MITKDWSELRKEKEHLGHQAATIKDRAMHDCELLRTYHRLSQEFWEKRMADMESSNQWYLIKINELLKDKDEWKLAMDAIFAELKEERNIALLAAAQLKRNYLRLSKENECLKTKVALAHVVETSKGCALSAFEMMVDSEDVPRLEHRLLFQESLYKVRVIVESPPTFIDSDEEEEENEEEPPKDGQDTPPAEKSL